MSAIAELIRAGVDPDLIARVVEEMVETARAGAPAKTARQERNARYYQTRKERLKASETTETVLIKTDKTPDDASRAENITTRAPALFPVGLSNDNPSINSPLVVPPDPETAPRKASRAKPRTQIAEDQLPEKHDAEYATAAGMSRAETSAEWLRFRDYHRSKGSVMADWSAAWRTWVGNRERFGQPRAGPPSRGIAARALLEIKRRKAENDQSRSTTQALEFLPIECLDGG